MAARRDKNVSFEECFEALRPDLSLPLTSAQLEALARHFHLLLKWNQKINLTSLRDPAAIVRRHFGESLFLASLLPTESGMLVDIGSGAGFPGLPIAVAKPNLEVTLVESVGKKAFFLKEVARGIANARVFHGRIEDLRGGFDWAVSRGVAAGALLNIIVKKANRLAVITGSVEAAELSRQGSLRWADPVPLPWEVGRVVLMRSRNVSRETSATLC